jgi:hypothetical protein
MAAQPTTPPSMAAQPAPLTSAPPLDPDNALPGAPPPIFDGERSNADKFWQALRRYRMLNRHDESCSIPYDRVLTALSFMSGPAIDDWIEAQTDDLEAKVSRPLHPYAETDERLWTEFARAFTNSYTYTNKEQEAYAQLMRHEMQGQDIDTYIATFDHLMKKSGWSPTDLGILEKFKRGLARRLALRIMNLETPPTDLSGWKDAARREVLREAQISADLGERPPSPPPSSYSPSPSYADSILHARAASIPTSMPLADTITVPYLDGTLVITYMRAPSAAPWTAPQKAELTHQLLTPAMSIRPTPSSPPPRSLPPTLHPPRQKGLFIKAYNKKFNQFVTDAGWDPRHSSTISQYKKGLSRSTREDLANVHPPPRSLSAWQLAALGLTRDAIFKADPDYAPLPPISYSSSSYSRPATDVKLAPPPPPLPVHSTPYFVPAPPVSNPGPVPMEVDRATLSRFKTLMADPTIRSCYARLMKTRFAKPTGKAKPGTVVQRQPAPSSSHAQPGHIAACASNLSPPAPPPEIHPVFGDLTLLPPAIDLRPLSA